MPEYVLKLLLAALLLSIAYSDLRQRHITLLQVLLLGALSVALAARAGWPVLWRQAMLNSVFLASQFGLLWVWFSLRERRPARLFEHYIGLGDLLFLLAITPVFPFRHFVWFYTTSAFLVLLLALLLKGLRPTAFDTIPLAGGLACCFLIYLLLEIQMPAY
ncbi:MAG: prepilin peptidase [Saprospiraceae bacterium]|nr:prepilin peptidase [Saprospiraceae bacterium]